MSKKHPRYFYPSVASVLAFCSFSVGITSGAAWADEPFFGEASDRPFQNLVLPDNNAGEDSTGQTNSPGPMDSASSSKGTAPVTETPTQQPVPQQSAQQVSAPTPTATPAPPAPNGAQAASPQTTAKTQNFKTTNILPSATAATKPRAGAKSAPLPVVKPVIKTGTGNPGNDDVLKEVFALTEKPRTQESMDQIFAMEKEGQAFLSKSEFSKALTKFQDMYALCKEVKYGDGEGRALERMASLYLAKSEKSRAKSLVENAMEVLSTSQDKKSLGRARVTAAQVYLALDNPLWALRQLDEAMKDFNSAAVTDNDEAARAMLLAAELAVKTDQPKEAIQFYRSAAVYFGQCGNHGMEVNLHNTAAGMLQEAGLLAASLEEAQKAVSIARSEKNDVMLAAALTQQASSQYGLCEYMNARKSLEEILNLKIDKQPNVAFAVITEAYGHALGATGSMDHAKTCLEKSWKILKEGGAPVHRAQVLNGLGVLNSLSGNYGIAIEQLRQALDAQSVVGKGKEKFGLMISQNIASALSRSGENRKAKDELEGVLRTMSKLKSPNPQVLGQIYASLGEVCLHLKEIPQADAYLKRSIEVASKINDDATLWRNYTNQARLQTALGESAAEALASAASCFRSPQAGVFTTVESNPFPSTRDELSSELINLLLSNNMVEQAFITAEQVKEEGFINEWQKNGGEVKPHDRELYNDLVQQRAHLHAAEGTSTPDQMLKKWQDWMRRHQVLAADNRELARLISPVPLNLSELVGKAQENQATVLDYLVGPKQSFVFIIDRQGRLGAAKLAVGRDQLKAQINAMLSTSQKSGPEQRQSEKRILQVLFNELVPEHVARFLPANPDQLVLFVPDSVLFNLPFAALVDAQGRYLVETHTLTTLPAVLSFLDNGVGYGVDQALVFNASSDSGESRQALEESELSNMFADQLVKLVGQDADLSQLQERAKSNAVFHFSAPLLLQDNNLLSSALPMTTQGKDKKVTAESLFKLNLPSDLAVWSGTTVNPKDSQGGGIKVLSRGLAYAGVRNVLLSLWVEQNPQRTEELLEFYKGRQQGLTQAQSLRKAQLIALSKNPSPRAWAAFALIGIGK